MIHEEWRGNRRLIERMLERTGLNDIENCGEKKIAMKWIIWYKYVDLMTVDQSLARLVLDHNIDLSMSGYYRLLNKAIDLLEKYS